MHARGPGKGACKKRGKGPAAIVTQGMSIGCEGSGKPHPKGSDGRFLGGECRVLQVDGVALLLQHVSTGRGRGSVSLHLRDRWFGHPVLVAASSQWGGGEAVFTDARIGEKKSARKKKKKYTAQIATRTGAKEAKTWLLSM